MTLQGMIKLMQLLQNYSLTAIQWQILLVVHQNPNQSITGLVNDGKLLCGNPSDIAVTVKRLGEGRRDRPGLGLITKSIDQKDKRYFKLTLSKRGKQLVKKIEAKIKTID